MRAFCSVLSVVLVAAVATNAAQRGGSEATNRLAAAKAAQASGDLARALDEYNLAEAALEGTAGTTGRGRGAGAGRGGAAAASGGGQAIGPQQDALRYDVMLNHARLLVSTADENSDRGSHAVQAERLYRRLLDSGTASQQNLVRNELGTLLLGENRAREAVPVLSAIQFDADPSQRFVYRFNAGRALEATGNLPGAASNYVAAAVDKPEFEPAVDAAIAALNRKFNAVDADRFVWKLVQSQQIHDLDRATAALIPAADSNAAAASLLSARLVWEVEAKIDHEAFVRTEQAALKNTRQSIGATVADVVSRAYLDGALAVPRGGEGPMTGDFYKLMGTPTPPRSLNAVALPAAYARVVKHTGDLYEARELHKQALARYLYAWAFDQSDGSPAVSAATLIKQHPELDPDKEVLDSLINRIFSVKARHVTRHPASG